MINLPCGKLRMRAEAAHFPITNITKTPLNLPPAKNKRQTKQNIAMHVSMAARAGPCVCSPCFAEWDSVVPQPFWLKIPLTRDHDMCVFGLRRVLCFCIVCKLRLHCIGGLCPSVMAVTGMKTEPRAAPASVGILTETDLEAKVKTDADADGGAPPTRPQAWRDSGR